MLRLTQCDYIALRLIFMAIFVSASSQISAQSTQPAMQTGMLSATSFGAKGDGKTDDTASIQRAIDAAGEKGGIVLLPARPLPGGR
jgi:polygalacturonase